MDNLDTALAELVTKVNGAVDWTALFMADQLPDYIQQLLMWEFVRSLAGFLTCTFVLVASVVVLRDVWSKTKGQSLDDQDRNNTRIASLSLAAPIVLFTACQIKLDWLQILIAPKVYLVEYASKLVS